MDRLGKYELLKHIADGATAAIFLAHDPFAGRNVAIKLFRSQVFNENERGAIARKLFMSEAALAGKLDHPHIVRIFDAVMEEGRSYIVMEYVPGGTLHAYTSPDRLLPLADVIEIAFKCSRALGYAQRLGVIHCDLKPANILLAGEPGGTDIKVSDFGSAFNLAAEETIIVGLGSPAYMSPQQIKEYPLNHQTDIFSLGIVMYELLTGLRPFRGENKVAISHKILDEEPPPPSALRRDIPAAIDAIVMRCLRKPLEERYSDWDELSLALAEVFRTERLAELRTAHVGDSEKFSRLRQLAFFRDFSDADLWEVLHFAEWRQCAAGRRLMSEGEHGDSFAVLVAGEVAVTKHGHLLGVLGAGDCFGDMAYLAPANRSRAADVTAVGEATILSLGTEPLQRASTGCRHNVDRAFLRILIERLEVANKLIDPEVLKDAHRGRLFRHLVLNEASLAGKLVHPHIVQIYDAVIDDERSYIVMEYAPGGTLEPFCRPDNLLPLDRLVEIVFKCTRALDYAFRAGITHRDIKPANILLAHPLAEGGASADIKISDFGAALDSRSEQTRTQVSGVGSPAYMSPQQVREMPLDHQTDIYSLGVVMFQLLN